MPSWLKLASSMFCNDRLLALVERAGLDMLDDAFIRQVKSVGVMK